MRKREPHASPTSVQRGSCLGANVGLLPDERQCSSGQPKRKGNRVGVNFLRKKCYSDPDYDIRTDGHRGAGAPRIQLGISGDGNGTFNQFPGGPDQNAFGYLSDSTGFQIGCAAAPNNQWVHEDMTDSAPKWDLTQFAAPCGMNCTWVQMVTFLNTVFPNHRVLNASLVDDAAGFVGESRGCAYYDLVTTGARTLNDHTDTSGGGKQPNNC